MINSFLIPSFLVVLFLLILLYLSNKSLFDVKNKLEERGREFNETAKVLVRRDLELTETNERLQEMDVAKSEFVSIAAHQLRTPLTGIKWTVQSLLEEGFGKLNDDQKKVVTDALAATNRLVDLIDDLLDVARLEEGRFGFTFKKQAFVPFFKNIFERFKKVAKDKGVNFSLELSDPKLVLLDVNLNIDEEKIDIVFDNLFNNAIKYTHPGGKVVVTLWIAQNNEQILVKVEDNGIGISQEQSKKIFTKFFRGRNAQLYQTSGTGLGLYLTKNIVEHHKGSISFESKEGKGSTFIVCLPISPSE